MERILKDRARTMRQAPTDAEQKLWHELRAKQIAGHKFRRQAVIGSYIVDFVCFEKKLIIELDGGQHLEQQSYDDARSQWLKSQGYKVLRIWNNQLLNETSAVLEMTLHELENCTPHPSPLPQGERA